MSKNGIYKTHVKKARDDLIAQGRTPSLDAIRVALGNTGSRTTIHKYLKELAEEDGDAGGGGPVSISEALQDLVQRLAARLHEEANAQVDAMRTAATEKERQHQQALQGAHDEIARLRQELARIEAALQQERDAHGRTREALQQETIACRTAQQRVDDLQERLADREAHCASLEHKHRDARETLEHYRALASEQRKQEQSRHENEIQQLRKELLTATQTAVVKQDEVARLNLEGARLVADITNARGALYDAQQRERALALKVEEMGALAQRNAVLEAQLADKQAKSESLQQELTACRETVKQLEDRTHAQQITLAKLQSANDAQQEMVAQLRTIIGQQGSPAASGTPP